LLLTSTPGIGTTFKAFFPVPETSDYAEKASTTAAFEGEASGSILLAEDEEMLRIQDRSIFGLFSIQRVPSITPFNIFRN
jgi:hypothetical protein